jgi:hypothetical protein
MVDQRKLALFIAAVLALAAFAGCRKWHDKMESGRQALLDSATPCPAPATCTAKMTVSQRQVSTCSAPPADGKMYAVGDTVVVKDIGGIDTLARVKTQDGKNYRVEFAEGVTNQRDASTLIAQVCK